MDADTKFCGALHDVKMMIIILFNHEDIRELQLIVTDTFEAFEVRRWDFFFEFQINEGNLGILNYGAAISKESANSV